MSQCYLAINMFLILFLSTKSNILTKLKAMPKLDLISLNSVFRQRLKTMQATAASPVKKPEPLGNVLLSKMTNGCDKLLRMWPDKVYLQGMCSCQRHFHKTLIFPLWGSLSISARGTWQEADRGCFDTRRRETIAARRVCRSLQWAAQPLRWLFLCNSVPRPLN